MEFALQVAVTAIVILIVALVVLTVFTGGIQNVVSFINSVFGDPCKLACDNYQFTCTENRPYNELPGCSKDGTCECKKGIIK